MQVWGRVETGIVWGPESLLLPAWDLPGGALCTEYWMALALMLMGGGAFQRWQS